MIFMPIKDITRRLNENSDVVSPSVDPSTNSADSLEPSGDSDSFQKFISELGIDPTFFDSLIFNQGFSPNQHVDDLFGSNSSALADFFNEQSDIAFNKSQSSADTLMNWQERMANTSMQRRMADLKSAGLNPKLAYQLGGADIGSGATATYDSVSDPLVQALVSLLSSDTTRRGQDLSKESSERSQNMSLIGEFVKGWFNMVSSLMNSKEMLS